MGRGWHSFIFPVLERVEEEGFELLQIKEKFGGLRLYVQAPEGASKETITAVYDLVRSAETESYRTCEECGKPGTKVLVEDCWWKTRCKDCGTKRFSE